MNTKIKVARIKCEADRAYNRADDMHLLTSIKNRLTQGLKPLLQPIALKKLEDDSDFNYAVDDGRRRFKALVAAGLAELELGQEAVLIDGDSEVNAYVANQHTDLSLAEEIKKLYSMREKFKTLDSLAAEIGHSPTWVARRLNLLNLSDLWKKAMTDKVFGYMTVAHYETIATFPASIQDDIFDFIRSVEGRELKTASVRKFTEQLYEKFATLLSSLPWKEEGCGECPACKERRESGFLFANLIPEPRCMNREYLERKRKEYVASLAAEEPETVLVSQSYHIRDEAKEAEDNPLSESTILGPGDWREADKPEDGVPAIIADGPRAGTKITIQRPKASGEAEPKPVKTLAERKAAKEKQRKRRTIEKLIDFLKGNECATPKRGTLYLLMACKGVGSICGGRFDYASKSTVDPTGLPASVTSIHALKERADIDTLVWQRVLENIVNELNNGQSGPNDPGWDAAELLSEITGFNLNAAFEESVKELPDPKAWEALAKAEEKIEKEKLQEAA